MNLKDLYINFFIEKGHKQIPSAPVVPENDNTVLFNTAGMQPLIPYLMGQAHPYGKRLCDYQKCIRTNDLDEVGDSYHHTFFEMLGNWSLGDYFKKEAITWSFEFLTKVLNIPVEKLAVTVFAGNEVAPMDLETKELWMNLGIKEERICATKEDNWWPNLELPGLCGPDSEMFYWRSEDPVPEKFDPEDSRWVEIWNDVFMQYNHNEDGTIVELPKKNVDTGMGVERTTAILEGKTDNYESSIWTPIIEIIEKVSNKKYQDNKKSMRIIADHLRTAVFISADPAIIRPSNVGQGYILRRLIRRAIRHAKNIGIDINSNWEQEIAIKILDMYSVYYKELVDNRNTVLEVLNNEKVKFNRTLEKGLKEFNKVTINNNDIDGITAFHLFDTYGFPIELTEELAKERNLKVDIDGFNKKFKEHQELSRTASAGQFKGGLGGHGEVETKYHTATHLLNAALKEVVNKDIHQKGSNITSERLRFDFNCDHKLTDEEKKKIEELVNNWINEGLEVTFKEMSKEEAIKSGAECMFIEKYPDIVTVYSIGNEQYGIVSKELCGGPHVNNTKELGVFKIKKEEASSAGVRRIKAILEEK
ncbi:MAG: alanine--tRNA ligase [Bacilli bacterium]|nr:alanine--tRNA ligase [Bacilli bacterium]